MGTPHTPAWDLPPPLHPYFHSFKSINDIHGHVVGDEVLRQVAHLVRSNARTVDQVARYGGEEMAIILPETTESGALKVAERIRQSVAGHSFTFEKISRYHLPLRATISLGVSSFPGDADTELGPIAAADKALYEAKKQGRNRTVLFSKNTLRTAPLSQPEG